jgi:hypothetical protein
MNPSFALCPTKRSRLVAAIVIVIGGSVGIDAAGATRWQPMFGSAESRPAGPIAWPDATVFVKNCNDDGPDSLRQAVLTAPDGAEVFFDFPTMACSKITLKSGEIVVAQQDLKLTGPGEKLVTISGGSDLNYHNRIFRHDGQGILEIDALTLADASVQTTQSAEAAGGCVRSQSGTVKVAYSTLSGCHLTAQPAARGGAISAYAIELSHSTITGNSVMSIGANAVGGGLFAAHALRVEYGTVSNNSALSQAFPTSVGAGGGAYSQGPAVFAYSTIATNAADASGGISASDFVTMQNTTVSGNSASLYGAASFSAGAALYASTVVLNRAGENIFSGGITASSLIVDSSIIALNNNNTNAMAEPSDLVVDSGYIFGVNNLIVSTNAALPPETVRDCPHIGPLVDNGGKTLTHALLMPSPAIDKGNAVAALTFDQRGISYVRNVNGTPDIGAYEWSQGLGDVISFTGFELCE